MNAEMWEELKRWLKEREETDGSLYVHDALKKATEIERRTLPERVAEILEKAEHNSMYMTCGGLTGTTQIIAKALRTGDTTEIEKWIKK